MYLPSSPFHSFSVMPFAYSKVFDCALHKDKKKTETHYLDGFQMMKNEFRFARLDLLIHDLLQLQLQLQLQRR